MIQQSIVGRFRIILSYAYIDKWAGVVYTATQWFHQWIFFHLYVCMPYIDTCSTFAWFLPLCQDIFARTFQIPFFIDIRNRFQIWITYHRFFFLLHFRWHWSFWFQLFNYFTNHVLKQTEKQTNNERIMNIWKT